MEGAQAALDICITTSGSCGSGSAPWFATFLSTLVGAFVALIGAYFLSRKQRDWQDSRALLDRQLKIAEALDTILVETQRKVGSSSVPDDEDEKFIDERFQAAHRDWEEGWVRLSPFLTDHELKERYASLGTILTEIYMYEGGASKYQLRRTAHRAVENARIGLAYFVRGESQPACSFPDNQSLQRLLNEGDPDPLLPDAPLRQWLDDHPPPAWHPESRS
jgi:hypothetical protein